MNYEQAEKAIEPHVNALAVYARDKSDKDDPDRLTDMIGHAQELVTILDNYHENEGKDILFTPTPGTRHILAVHADIMSLDTRCGVAIQLRRVVHQAASRVLLRRAMLDLMDGASLLLNEERFLMADANFIRALLLSMVVHAQSTQCATGMFPDFALTEVITGCLSIQSSVEAKLDTTEINEFDGNPAQLEALACVQEQIMGTSDFITYMHDCSTT